MTASKGLRPALLFLSSGAGLTTASISPRKLSNGTSALSISSGSPLALIASRRLSRSKKPGCPTAFPSAAVATTRESDLHAARHCYFSRRPNASLSVARAASSLPPDAVLKSAHGLGQVDGHRVFRKSSCGVSRCAGGYPLLRDNAQFHLSARHDFNIVCGCRLSLAK